MSSAARVLRPRDPLWERSYATILDPLPGESLAGFELRLDLANGFDGGDVMRQNSISRKSCRTFPVGRLVTGNAIDFDELAARTGGIAVSELERLTARPLLRWLFSRLPQDCGQRARFAVCPECAEQRQIPLASLFSATEGCARHGLQMSDRCSCGAPVSPFHRQRPFTCHACGTTYADLTAARLARRLRASVSAFTTTLEDLLSITPPPDCPGPTRGELRLAIRFLLRRRTGDPTDRLLHDSTYSLEVDVGRVARTLVAAQASSTDLIAALIEVRRGTTELRARSACPNPHCTSPTENVRRASSGHRTCFHCGTEFRDDRVVQAFDVQPGYAAWRAVRNQHQLIGARDRVAAICEEHLREGRRIRTKPLLRLAEVPGSPIFSSDRAGVRQLIDNFRRRDGRHRRPPCPVHPESTVHLAGFYRLLNSERKRLYKCVLPVGGHSFSEATIHRASRLTAIGTAGRSR